MKKELYEEFFKGKKVTVMGLGLLGRGVGDSRFLAEHCDEVIVTDKKTKDQLESSVKELESFPNIIFRLGEHRKEDFENRDFIIKAAGVPYEVVPGVTSGVAGPAAAGIPVTHRGVATSVTFATAQLAQGEPDWAHLAGAQTLVLFMAGKNTAAVLEKLIHAGLPPSTPAAVVESATWEHQRVTQGTAGTLGALVTVQGVASPALLVVGHVVSLRQELLMLAQHAHSDLVTHAS